MEPGPFLTINLNTVLQGVIIVVGGFALKEARAWMREIRETLRHHSDKIVSLEGWKISHDKQDDERHDGVKKHITSIWTEVRRLERGESE